ncbi:hypothetical protein V6356_13675 [Acinetobacter baumannii]|uniref:hypothetical protein n=1 Tax=Acinetobacter baumannii TaxID=470 RepID=UPI003B840D1F
MANLFGLLFFIFIIVTIILLIKPSLTALKNRPPLPRLKIFIYGLLAIMFSIVMIGLTAPKVDPKKLDVEKFSDDQVKVSQDKDGKIVVAPEEKDENKPPFELTDNPKQNVANAQAHYEKLAEEDKPHFDWPRVDYTKTVAKVDLSNDQAILSAVGKPVIEKEKTGNQNGEPATTYYFSKSLASGLDITLSRELINVKWQFDSTDPAKASAIFEDGQRVTRALLGGKVGSDVYENMAKGLKFSEIVTADGITLKNVRCGASICRYEVVRP